jgi:peptidoglycan/LPS O-acetylase OafA/YrhL
LERALSRITSGGNFIPALDGLRFVAITSVVFYHLTGFLTATSPPTAQAAAKANLLYAVLDKGNCGVQLFFIISGFILALPFVEHFLAAGKPVDLQRYYQRRLTRLVPPYFCNLIIAYAIQVTAGHGTALVLLPSFLASLFYVHNLTLGGMSLINGVAWSLEIEVQFYILAPLLALVFLIQRKNARRALLLGMIVALTAGKSVAEAAGLVGGVWRGTIVWYLDCFLAGLLLADIFVAEWNRAPTRSGGCDLVGLAAWGLVLLTQFDDIGRHWLTLPALLAYLAAFRGRLFNRVFSNVWLVTIGGMCYTIYLYHFFLISAVGHWTRPLTEGFRFPLAFVVQALLICPVVLIACAFLFVLFEKPFMRLGVSRRPTAVLAVEGAESR